MISVRGNQLALVKKSSIFQFSDEVFDPDDTDGLLKLTSSSPEPRKNKPK